MRILLMGAGGQVGWELARTLMPQGEVHALDQAECDLTRPETIPGVVHKINPDVIVNAAAYTAVDKAEEEEALASIINGTAVGVLAEAAYKSKALLVHYSTDFVFDGKKGSPYTEEDEPNPLNAYGRSKLAGEQAVQQVGGRYLIFRTSWVYAARGQNFLKTILRLARERDELNIVDDQQGAPTWARNIADATALALAEYHGFREQRHDDRGSGLYHLTAAGHTTWCGFASAIIEEAVAYRLLAQSVPPRINPIATDAYPLPAERPADSRLSMEKLTQRFRLRMPTWRSALARCAEELVVSGGG